MKASNTSALRRIGGRRPHVSPPLHLVTASVVLAFLAAIASAAGQEPGTRLPSGASTGGASPAQGLVPVVTETGRLAHAVDGLGFNSRLGIIEVEKPAGARVRRAFMVSWGPSFPFDERGSVTIDGAAFRWDLVAGLVLGPGGRSEPTLFADITYLLKPKIDAAPPGRIEFVLTEAEPFAQEGEILAVIFEDPGQLDERTVQLFAGFQAQTGDEFSIHLAEPIDRSDPGLTLNFGVGISFSAQQVSRPQFSEIDVNGERLSSSAGGEDDGIRRNGALLTVGGLDDSRANPPAFQPPDQSSRTDDELYDLGPFVAQGDTRILIETRNPSEDDNIFFASIVSSVPLTSDATCNGRAPTLTGTDEFDFIAGTPGTDVIQGLDGRDEIRGLAGDDMLCGGDGDDTIDGGSGDDVLEGQLGRDVVLGHDGSDRIEGGPSTDQLIGGHGDDTLRGQSGNDELYGGEGDDQLDGGSGDDLCQGAEQVSGDAAVRCEVVNGVP